MIVRFRCEDCGQKYELPDNHTQGEFRCIECGGKMEIPEMSTLGERKEVALASEDDRPLVQIPVVKKDSDNNMSDTAEVVDAPPLDDALTEDGDDNDEALQTNPAFDNKTAALKISPTPAKLSTQAKVKSGPSPGSAKLSTPPERSATLAPGSGSSLQIKPTPKTPASADKATSTPDKPPTPAKMKIPSIASRGDVFCEIHPHLRATSTCNTCQKPICLECRQQWGYYCSENCRDASLSSVDRKIKEERNQEYAKMNWIVRSIKIVLLGAACFLLGYLGLWVWKQFLDPGGKVAWKWEEAVSSHQFSYLAVKPDRLTILSNQSIITLDPQTGKVISSFTNDKLKNFAKLDKKTDNKLIFSGASGVAAVDWQGKFLWETTFQDPVTRVWAGKETALVKTVRWVESKKVRRTRNGYMRMPPTPVSHLCTLDLKAGKKLTRVKLDSKSYLNIVAVGDNNYITMATDLSGGSSERLMKINDLRSGETLWKIKLRNRLNMGPFIYNGNIIFKLGNTLNAVSMKGKKLWKAEVQGYCSSRNFRENDGLALFTDDNTLTVFDMDKGKVLWEKALDAGNISYVAGKLLMSIAEEDKEYGKHEIKVKLPPAYEKLKKEDPTIKAMLSGDKGKRVKYNRFMVCLNARTGKRLWKSKKVVGQLVTGGGRAVIFRDSATTTMLSVINSKHGKSVVEQLDLQTGEWLFSRNDDIGVAGPLVIVGDKLIGLMYDRNAGRPVVDFKNSSRSMPYSGIAAFNLK